MKNGLKRYEVKFFNPDDNECGYREFEAASGADAGRIALAQLEDEFGDGVIIIEARPLREGNGPRTQREYEYERRRHAQLMDIAAGYGD